MMGLFYILIGVIVADAILFPDCGEDCERECHDVDDGDDE